MPAKPEFVQFDTWAPDRSGYTPGGLEIARNVVYLDGTHQAVRGIMSEDDWASTEQPNAARQFYAHGGDDPVIVATPTRLWGSVMGGTVDKSKGGAAYAGANEWTLAQYGPNRILAATKDHPIQKSTDFGVFADMVTAPAVDKPQPEFIATILSFVIGASVKLSTAGTWERSRFQWSARDNEAQWTPGTDRAGFGYLRGDAGPITGLVGFSDFGILFAEFGVFRLDYIGGVDVWDVNQIGSASDGMPRSMRRSAIQFGRSVYYFSHSGPSVVVGGESCEPLGFGEWRRYVWDQKSNPTYAVQHNVSPFILAADVDTRQRVLLWAYTKAETATPAIGDPCLLLTYNIQEGAATIIEHGQPIHALAAARQQTDINDGHALENIRLFWGDGAEINRGRMGRIAGDLELPTLPITLGARRWMPSAGVSHIHSLRPRLLLNKLGGSYPTLSISIRAAMNPQELDDTTPVVVTTAADADPNGWISGGRFPLPGSVFDFTVTCPAMNDSTISEFTGIDLMAEDSAAK